MDKILLIQPPQWYPITPHLAVPLLSAQLKKAGLTCDITDLNVKFYNRILTKAHLAEADRKAKADLSALAADFETADVSAIEKSGSYGQKTRCLKYLTLKKFYKEYGEEIPALVDGIGLAVKTMKDPALFFDPERLPKAKRDIKLALRLASMPFAPNELDLDNYFPNPVVNWDWPNIKAQVVDGSLNMFRAFLSEAADAIADAGYTTVCISVADLSQVLPVFTLAGLLKEKTDAKIVLGGNYATQIYEDIMKFSDIFGGYLDYIMIGDGELSLPLLCKAVAEGLPMENVPNLVYWDAAADAAKCTGFSCPRIDMDAPAYPDFTGYDFGEYFTPEIVFPVQLSKGCYWGKCTFCDYAYGQQGYSPKHIPRILDELRFLIGTYGASKFIFVDEAIPPAFYRKLSEAIIEAGLQIHFYSFARLENGYTPEVLQTMYRAGARLFLWGYECAAERIMEKMNKGIDPAKRLQILTDARNAGIWNNGLFIFGYPTETMDEIKMTMDVIRNNRRVIPSCTLSNFTLKKHSLLVESVGSNGVLGYAPNGDFYTTFKDEVDGVERLQRRSLRRQFQFDFLEENAHCLWAVVFSDFDHLLLYLAKYGCDYVSGYRSENRICPEFR